VSFATLGDSSIWLLRLRLLLTGVGESSNKLNISEALLTAAEGRCAGASSVADESS
jgi:hypothetical protein